MCSVCLCYGILTMTYGHYRNEQKMSNSKVTLSTRQKTEL